MRRSSHEFLATESYGVPGISRADVDRCIANSLCFGAYLDGRQVGFARLATDLVRFAHLMNVFVLKELRGRGWSKQLIGHILGYPPLAAEVRFTLGTADAHGLYRQLGFGTTVSPERTMELIRDIVSAGE